MSETMFFLLLVLPGFVAGFVVAAWFATTNWRSIGVFALGFGAAAFVGMAVDPNDDDDWGGLFEMFLIIGNLIGWTLGAGFGTAAAWTRVKRSS